MHDDRSAEQARLLHRIAAQDRQALAELYDQVASVLFSTCCRILGDPHEAEEVTQDVFVQIWKKAATFDVTLGTAFHWATGIARNRAIDRLRSRNRRTQLLDDLRSQVSAGSTPTPGPSPGRLGDDELAAIQMAVHSLPDEQRRALEMAFFGGLTHAEIAEATGEPLGTIKARIRRAMLKLRDLLQVPL